MRIQYRPSGIITDRIGVIFGKMAVFFIVVVEKQAVMP